jgi:putative oxidoreductase
MLMKTIFNTNYNHTTLDIFLLILRVGVSCLMLTHGMAKLGVALSGAEIQFGDPIGVGMKTSFYLAIFSEVICAVLLILGLCTRLVVIPLIVTMVVAAFVVHPPDGFQKMELPILYLLNFVFLLFVGPGRFSIDNVISRSTNRRRTF